VAFKRVVYKPTCWFCYVDDIFMIWPHELEQLKNFLNHLSNIHPSIQFTMETESNGQDSSLGHNVSNYSSSCGRQLQSFTHHHPSSFLIGENWVFHQYFDTCSCHFLNEEGWGRDYLSCRSEGSTLTPFKGLISLHHTVNGLTTMEKWVKVKT